MARQRLSIEAASSRFRNGLNTMSGESFDEAYADLVDERIGFDIGLRPIEGHLFPELGVRFDNMPIEGQEEGDDCLGRREQVSRQFVRGANERT